MGTGLNIPAACKWLAAILIAEWLHVPGVMRALVFFMAVDYITGVGAAIVRREISSHIAWRGLVRKTLILVLLLAIRLGERAAGLGFNIEQVGSMGYLVTEVISIVENLAQAGVPIPANVVAALLAAKQINRPATQDEIEQLTSKN